LKRRVFIKQAARSSLALGLGAGFYAWQIEPFWLEIVELEMPLQNLPSALDGSRLVQISDLHVGSRFDPQFLIDTFATLKELGPAF